MSSNNYKSVKSDERPLDSSSTMNMSNNEELSHVVDVDDIEKANSTTQRSNSTSTVGSTEVEQIAERIEKRRAERVRVTFKARVRFLKDCQKIARSKHHTSSLVHHKDRIHKKDLIEYQEKIQEETKSANGRCGTCLRGFGIKSDILCLSRIVDRAVELLEGDEIDTGDWLYYKDFSYDYTRVVSRWPHMRSELGLAALIVLLYYALTPVLFCVIMPSSNICNADDTWKGIVDSLYFASTTISTVGYGDLTVDQDPWYRSLVGSLYMLVSMVVAVVAFSAIASSTFSPLEKPFDLAFKYFTPDKEEKDLFLYQRIAKIKTVKITELTLMILTFIMVGVLGAQIFIYFDDNPVEGTDWNWMTSIYWAVQTTTTIGYGDLAQPESLRYFKIFYLMVSTVLVGNALGKLGDLKEELSTVRRQHAFDRRPVTRRMIDEMQAYDHDDKVDQYEFLVASLISLGHISSEQITPIMDKFREHAGEKGYIAADDEIEDELNGEDAISDMEEDVIDTEL